VYLVVYPYIVIVSFKLFYSYIQLFSCKYV